MVEVSLIMPAFNEEENIQAAIQEALEAFDSRAIKAEILVINDGSTDRTQSIVENLKEKDQRIKLINHGTNKGFGQTFWTGVDHALGEIITSLPGDNENDPKEIFRYYRLLDHVDIVIPFIYNKESRSLFRNFLSYAYRFIINSTFVTHLNYTNGNVLYRASILRGLKHRNTSFFFQTDILIRLIKSGYLFAEVPYRIRVREGGKSSAVTFPSFFRVVKGYFYLVGSVYSLSIFSRKQKKSFFPNKTLTANRRIENKA